MFMKVSIKPCIKLCIRRIVDVLNVYNCHGDTDIHSMLDCMHWTIHKRFDIDILILPVTWGPSRSSLLYMCPPSLFLLLFPGAPVGAGNQLKEKKLQITNRLLRTRCLGRFPSVR